MQFLKIENTAHAYVDRLTHAFKICLIDLNNSLNKIYWLKA